MNANSIMFNPNLTNDFGVFSRSITWLRLKRDNFNDNLPEKINSQLTNVRFDLQNILDGKKSGENRYELLARFGGDMPITKILEILRTSGKTFDLFKKSSKEAFELIHKNNTSISVNLYVEDLKNVNFVSHINSLISFYNIDNNLLTFEILENDPISAHPESLENIKYLKNLGFKISIDDINFDSHSTDNYSYDNLMYLIEKGIIPDEIKFDGKFIEELYKTKDQQKISEIQQIIKFLKDKGIEDFVGEWISTIEQGKFARDNLGCNLFQGRDLKPETFNLH